MTSCSPRITLFSLLIAGAAPCMAQPVTFNAAAAFQGTGHQYITRQVLAPDGSLYLLGNTYETMDLDPGPGEVLFTANGTTPAYLQGFLVKLDPNGDFAWGQGLAGDDQVFAGEMTLLADGNLLHVAQFLDNIDLDPGPGVSMVTAVGGYDLLIRKLTPAGELLWSERIGGIGRDYVNSVVETPDGGIVIAGAFTNETVLDPAGVQGHHAAGFSDLHMDMFVVKLDATGAFVWSGACGGEQHEEFTAVTVMPSGNLLLTGIVEYASADIDPGPGELIVDPGEGRTDFLLELDPAGNFVQAHPFGSSEQALIHAVYYGLAGELYVAGGFRYDITFGPGTPELTAPFEADYILKYDAAGTLLWAKAFNEGDGTPLGLALDPDGNLMVCGMFQGGFDPDPMPGNAPFTNAGATDIFLMEWDADGNYRWCQTWGGPGTDQGRDLAIRPDGAILMAGSFSESIDLDPGPATAQYTSQGAMDGLVARFNEAPCAGLHYAVTDLQPVLCGVPGSLSGTIVGGIPPYTYAWDLEPPPPGLEVTLDDPGTAIIAVTDAAGCTDTRTFIVPGVEFQEFELSPVLVSSSLPAGEVGHLWVDVANAGCPAQDVELQVTLPPHTSFVEAEPAPTTVNGNILTWAFDEVAATFPPLHVRVDLLVAGNTPAAFQACFQAVLTPSAGDHDPANNTQELCRTVLNSYDPNDKQVVPRGLCDEGFVALGTTFRYGVRFQNTGNAPAHNVTVADTLSPLLDPASLRILAYSHPMYAEWATDHVLRFVFDGIELPDSTSNEPESHGHVVFELDPVAAHAAGDRIENSVGIYFDHNDPVITNTVGNTFVDVLPTECAGTGVGEGERLSGLSVRPNPSRGTCWLDPGSGVVMDRVRIHDTQGRLLQEVASPITGPLLLELPGPGLYIAQVRQGQRSTAVRLVVE